MANATTLPTAAAASVTLDSRNIRVLATLPDDAPRNEGKMIELLTARDELRPGEDIINGYLLRWAGEEYRVQWGRHVVGCEPSADTAQWLVSMAARMGLRLTSAEAMTMLQQLADEERNRRQASMPRRWH